MAIDRRTFIGSMVSGIAAANTKSLLGQALPQPAARQSGRPNFLFMIADDMTYRAIHSLNNVGVRTPALDRLAASGCYFSHCYHQGSWTGAVCVASRTMLNTGLSAFQARGAWMRNGAFIPPGDEWMQVGTVGHNTIDDFQSWAETLRAAGYDTFLTGKWHLDRTLLERGFKSTGPVGPGMFPSTPAGGNAYYRPRPGDPWEPWDETLKGHWLDIGELEAHGKIKKIPGRKEKGGHEKAKGIEHSCSLYTNHVVDYLENNAAKSETSFFIYMGFNSPHDPRQSPREFLNMYPQNEVEVPPNFLPQHPFDQGDYKIRDEILAPFPRTRKDIQLHRKEYYSLISYMDHQISGVLDALEASGKASNTYVIFTADHGLAVGEHGLMGKQNMYECSVRMPLMISGPGIAKGQIVDELVYQHCMYATTCDLAGVPVPKHVAFPSIAPMLHGNTKPVYDDVFSYYRGFQRMVRTKTHKLIVYPQVQITQLFDLEKDPWEMYNMVEDPASQSIKADLMSRLLRLQKELGDPLSIAHPTPGATNPWQSPPMRPDEHIKLV